MGCISDLHSAHARIQACTATVIHSAKTAMEEAIERMVLEATASAEEFEKLQNSLCPNLGSRLL